MKKPLVLILAGGKGERFWPRSRAKQPKQLQKIYSKRSMLAETVARARLLTDKERIFIGCDAHLQRAIQKAHPEIAREAFIIEPVGRNTAPMIALAALTLESRFPRALQVVLPVDHYIAPLSLFQSTLQKALLIAQQGYLVTLGVKPSRPEVGYGYIHAGRRLPGLPGCSIRKFVEKPDRKDALKYLKSGNYYWNCGIFVWPGELILEEFERHSPEIVRPLRDIFLQPKKLNSHFPHLPKKPVDIAIMEKSERVAMIPAQFQWDDLGSWLSLERILPAKANGNRFIAGESGRPLAHISVESKDNLIFSNHRLIALLGVNNSFVVEDKDVLLLAHRNALPRIKELVHEIKKNPSLHKYLN